MASIDRNSVLIVGSSPNRDLVAAALESAGLRVDHTENPYEATLRFDEGRPGGVLFFLDGLDPEDLELIRTIRRISASTRILATFSLPGRHLATRAIELGADAYLLEPFHLMELVQLLRRSPVEGGDGARQVPAALEATPLALEEFAGGVAHEINNPLTIVSGWVEVLLADSSPASEEHARLQSILEETRRIQRAVDHLQAFSRAMPGERVEVDLNAEIRAFFEQESARSRLMNVEIQTRLASELPPIRADRDALQTLLRQLTQNALTATEGKGRVEVTTRQTATGDVQIIFEDDGPGIPDEYRDRLFLPFFSGFSGDNCTGLGLAACRGIVHGHGGTIRLLDRPGAGAAFEITLPAQKGLSPEATSE